MTMDKKDSSDIFYAVCGYGWLICWILAIWTRWHGELFLTGLLLLTVGCLSSNNQENSNG